MIISYAKFILKCFVTLLCTFTIQHAIQQQGYRADFGGMLVIVITSLICVRVWKI